MISRTNMYKQAAEAVANYGTNTSTTRASENLFVGGTAVDIVKNDSDSSVILTGDGKDVITSTGDGNTVGSASGENTIVVIGNNNHIQGGTGADSIAAIGDKNSINAGNGVNTLALIGDKDDITTGKNTDYIYTLDFAIKNGLFTSLSGYLEDYAEETDSGVHIDGLISNTKIHDEGGYNYVGLNVADGLTDINIDKATNTVYITSGADWISS